MYDTNSVKTKMTAAVERFKEEMKKVRTGRAHPDMLSSVKAEVYGQYTPLNQIANVTVSGASMLLITPYDVANIAKIAAAIRADQSLGLNPSDDGRVIRVPIPPLTEERRREIVKSASGKVEEAKIALRQARDDARKDIKGGELTEDVKKRAEKDVDDMIKSFNAEIDKLFAEKEAEIMKI
ncbi:ribosome recycling factor [Candidatus Saccharibacteria bacterium]|nr:ribosome recycling factor [Candidatus Saccharibacteria bacterium]